MSLPLYPKKLNEDPILKASEYIAYAQKKGWWPKESAPESVVMSFFQGPVVDYLKTQEDWETKRLAGAHWHRRESLAILSDFGIGAPAIALRMEELAAWGVKNFLLVGYCGSLSEEIAPGEIVVCTGAERDEGTSYQYLEAGVKLDTDPAWSESLFEQLRKQNVPVHRTRSWTTDAPYCESFSEVKHFRSQGVGCVEMEASAALAVAHVRNLKVAAMFGVSDSLADGQWHLGFHSKDLKDNLDRAFALAMEQIERESNG